MKPQFILSTQNLPQITIHTHSHTHSRTPKRTYQLIHELAGYCGFHTYV